MKAPSLVAAVLLFVVFLYMSFITIAVHLIPHLWAWEVDRNFVLILVVDILMLQLISYAYKKLPEKPKYAVFSWIEKISIF